MSYRKEDFANIPFGQLAAEGHITYLYELDPTHINAQPTSLRAGNAYLTTPVRRAPFPTSEFLDITAAAVLLELDPTHGLVR